MKQQRCTTNAMILTMGVSAFFMLGQMNAPAQQPGSTDLDTAMVNPGGDEMTSEYVTINVKNANISEVLKAYSLQTGQSIVVGPDVVSDNVNVRLNNIPWQEALDVILKPYGFGYRVVGDTIVISKLENIVTVEGIEPLASKLFTLKYLDAYDIKSVCEAQLTSRGKFTILQSKGLPGWEFGGGSAGRGATEEGGVRQRAKKEQIQKSKTIVITDVPASLTAISDIIEKMDVPPVQVLIEARFLEVNLGKNSDIGLDLLTAMENVVGPGIVSATAAPVDGGGNLINPIESITDTLQGGAQAKYNHDNGLRLASANIGDFGFDMLFKLQQSTDDVNVLSAPRVLTLDNQEAAILVGQKYPILRANTSGGSASSQSTITLDYYENIGIQLNVLPQVSDGQYVNMVVHPVVSEIQGFTDGTVQLLESDISKSTKYPIMTIREAETQILLKSQQVAVIGGLQTQKDSVEVKKVPFLADIPFLGRLFRREVKGKEKIDLLIFIKATIIDRDAYSAESAAVQHEKEVSMGLVKAPAEEETSDEADMVMEEQAAPAADVSMPEEVASETEDSAPAADEVDNEEILALVRDMNAPTNAVVDDMAATTNAVDSE